MLNFVNDMHFFNMQLICVKFSLFIIILNKGIFLQGVHIKAEGVHIKAEGVHIKAEGVYIKAEGVYIKQKKPSILNRELFILVKGFILNLLPYDILSRVYSLK